MTLEWVFIKYFNFIFYPDAFYDALGNLYKMHQGREKNLHHYCMNILKIRETVPFILLNWKCTATNLNVKQTHHRRYKEPSRALNASPIGIANWELFIKKGFSM